MRCRALPPGRAPVQRGPGQGVDGGLSQGSRAAGTAPLRLGDLRRVVQGPRCARAEGARATPAPSWVATRLFNFGVMCIQPLQNELTEIARSAGGGRREQFSDQLLILAGHLSATNYDNRKFAEVAGAGVRVPAQGGGRRRAEFPEDGRLRRRYPGAGQHLVVGHRRKTRGDVVPCLPNLRGASTDREALAGCKRGRTENGHGAGGRRCG